MPQALAELPDAAAPAGTDEPTCRADLDGELTIQVAAERRPELQAIAAACADGRTLHLDVHGITEADSAGVQLLLALRHSVQDRGARLVLDGLRGALAQALRTYRLDSRLQALDMACASTGGPAA